MKNEQAVFANKDCLFLIDLTYPLGIFKAIEQVIQMLARLNYNQSTQPILIRKAYHLLAACLNGRLQFNLVHFIISSRA